MENIRRQILNYLETNSRIDLKELRCFWERTK